MPVALHVATLTPTPTPASAQADETVETDADSQFADLMADVVADIPGLAQQLEVVSTAPKIALADGVEAVPPIPSQDATVQEADLAPLQSTSAVAAMILPEVQFAALLAGKFPVLSDDLPQLATPETSAQAMRQAMVVANMSEMGRKEAISVDFPQTAATEKSVESVIQAVLPSVSSHSEIAAPAFAASQAGQPLPVEGTPRSDINGQNEIPRIVRPEFTALPNRAKLAPEVSAQTRGPKEDRAELSPIDSPPVSVPKAERSHSATPSGEPVMASADVAQFPPPLDTRSQLSPISPLPHSNAVLETGAPDRAGVPPGPAVPQQVAQQIAVTVATTRGHATEILLDPQELGRVKLSVQAGDAAIVVLIQAERPETVDLMRRHIDQLGQEFRSLGYQDVTFSFGTDQERHDANQFINQSHDAEPDATNGTVLGNSLPSQPAPRPISATGHLDLRL